MFRSGLDRGDDRLALRIGQVSDNHGKSGLHHRQEGGGFHRTAFDREEHGGFFIREGRSFEDLVVQDIHLGGGIGPGGDGHRHHILTPAAQPDAVTEGVVTVTARKDIESGDVGPGTETLHRSLPVHAHCASRLLIADHHLGTIDKSATHDGMDRLRAQAGAFGQHVIADGREGRTVHDAFVHIVAKRLEFGIDFLTEGRIRDKVLEIGADLGEGGFRVDTQVQGLLQHVDEHLAHLVLGFHNQDGILLREAAQIFRRRLGQPENAGYHRFK